MIGIHGYLLEDGWGHEFMHTFVRKQCYTGGWEPSQGRLYNARRPKYIEEHNRCVWTGKLNKFKLYINGNM